MPTIVQREEALLQAGALQSAIFNSADFSSIATDANGVIQIFNVGAERMLGYTATEVISKITPADISDPQELIGRATALSVEFGTPIAPGFEALVFKASRGIEDIYALTYIRKDGSRLPAMVSVTALRDGQAAIIGYLLIGSDNTARKHAEEALLEMQVATAAELAAIGGAVSDAAIIAVTDVTGKIEQVNDNFVRISKYSREELVGQNHRLVNSDWHPKGFFRDLWGTIAKGQIWRNDIRNRAKDGSLYWVDTTISPVLNERGKPVKYIAVRFDITARKRAEESLLKSGALQSAIFNSANFSSIATDARGVIQIFNVGAERMLGYTAAEVMNKITPANISDPQEVIARAEALSAELGTPITPGFEALVFKASRGIEDIYELTYIRKDGSRFPAVVSVTALRDAQATIIGYLLIGTDNTARKQAEAREVTERERVEVELKKARADAESASRTKSEFLASMSHEIRTPLNAIMGVADLLAKTSLSSEQDKYVQIFRRAGDNLLNLINDILDLSKVEASQLELEQTEFSLHDLLEKVTEMLAARAHEKGLALVCEISPDVPSNLVGDPTRLRQVLLNLVGNAIKFTESGEVSLCVAPDEDDAVPTALRFTISDTGIGISEDKLDRVFEQFTQADSSTTRRFGGSGLGLTISRRLVELMGGRIWVESEIDKGSVFSFVVPFETWAGSAFQENVFVGTGSEPPLGPLRILLAEDSPDNCTITLAYLADTPYQVEIAETGAVACEMFVAGHYDIVLMDRQMPVMDGLTATRTIRSWEQANQRAPTPIIALTASALKGDREKCLAAGCTAFLTKPIKQEVLLQAIKDHSVVTPPSPKEEIRRKDLSLVIAYPKLAARVPAFLQNRRRDVSTMLDSLARGDFATVERLGHSMHGSGASFGFQAITDFGAAIEQEARSAHTEASRKWVRELSLYLDHVGLAESQGLEHAAELTLKSPLADTRNVTGGLRIVLVDDDDDLRGLFCEALEQLGHHVTEARNGVEGLAFILAEKPDVAIVDIDMPAMDGHEVARRARGALGDSVRLVTMTKHGKESDHIQALSAGFDLHMTKPVDIELVQRMLENVPAQPRSAGG